MPLEGKGDLMKNQNAPRRIVEPREVLLSRRSLSRNLFCEVHHLWYDPNEQGECPYCLANARMNQMNSAQEPERYYPTLDLANPPPEFAECIDCAGESESSFCDECPHKPKSPKNVMN